MKPARQGVIINIGSVAGMGGKDYRVYDGTQMGGVTIDYAAAKGGVINMTPRDGVLAVAVQHPRELHQPWRILAQAAGAVRGGVQLPGADGPHGD